MLQNGQMTIFNDIFDQLKVQLFLRLNVMETNQFFSKERGSQYDQVWHKMGTQINLKM